MTVSQATLNGYCRDSMGEKLKLLIDEDSLD